MSTSPLSALLGEYLLVKSNDKIVRVSTDKHLQGKIVALYASAKWCGPCRQFTPILADAYKKTRKPVEVVFLSSDKDEEEFLSYYGKHHPWAAIPFKTADEMGGELRDQFGIRGIPALVILSPEGEVLSANARNAISQERERAFDRWC